MIRTILAPLDGSALARRALPYAAALARSLNARLILLHAYAAQARTHEADPELDVVMELSAHASELRRQGVQATTWLSYDESGAAIVQTVADLKADLLVMSTHGRGGLSRLLFGSVSEYVVQHAAIPVMLVTGNSHPCWPGDAPLSIVTPLDGTPFAEHALPASRVLAAGLDADIVLLRMPEPYITRDRAWQARRSFGEQRAVSEAALYLEAVAAPLRIGGRTVHTRVEPGTPAAAIAEVANDLSPSLVVMATHGRGRLSRLLLETVAAETLRKLHVPLLLVRPPREHLGPNADTTVTLERHA